MSKLTKNRIVFCVMSFVLFIAIGNIFDFDMITYAAGISIGVVFILIHDLLFIDTSSIKWKSKYDE